MVSLLPKVLKLSKALSEISAPTNGFVKGSFRQASVLTSTRIQMMQNESPSVKPSSADDLAFGSVFTDHMLTIPWDKKNGFHDPVVGPFQNLSIHPAASSLHYSLQLFEGMKAYRSTRTGRVHLFRPNKNMRRLNSSAQRIALPAIDDEEFLKCLAALVKKDEDWVPNSRKASLYIRPTYIATQPTLGVAAPDHALLFVIMSPVGPYFKTGTFSPVSLLADPKHTRAWEGGTGAYKLGGNYGPTIGVQKEAEVEKCQQILWLYGPNHMVTEVGAMNIFIFWTNQNGEKELITPPLDSLILPGVTRESIMELTRAWGEFPVVERPISMPEVYQAVLDGRLHEIFGAGTACVVCPVDKVVYKRSESENLQIDVPFHEESSLAKRIHTELTAIQYDEVDHPWSVAVDDVLDSSFSISQMSQ